MHNHELSGSIQTGLGVYYLLVVLLNLGFAAYFFQRKNRAQSLIWTVVAGVFLIHGIGYLAHLGWKMPVAAKRFRDDIMNPVTYFVLAVLRLWAFLRIRRFFTEPVTAWAILNMGLLLSGWAMTDPSFQEIITKEDNVPI